MALQAGIRGRTWGEVVKLGEPLFMHPLPHPHRPHHLPVRKPLWQNDTSYCVRRGLRGIHRLEYSCSFYVSPSSSWALEYINCANWTSNDDKHQVTRVSLPRSQARPLHPQRKIHPDALNLSSLSFSLEPCRASRLSLRECDAKIENGPPHTFACTKLPWACEARLQFATSLNLSAFKPSSLLAAFSISFPCNP